MNHSNWSGALAWLLLADGEFAHARRPRSQGIQGLRTSSNCSLMHASLPEQPPLRRSDTAGVIGKTLSAKVTGTGLRSIAPMLNRPFSTVQFWLRLASSTSIGLQLRPVDRSGR